MNAQFRQLTDQVVHLAVLEHPLGQGDMNIRFAQQRKCLFDTKPNTLGGGRHDPGAIAVSGAVEEFYGITSGQAQHAADVARIRTRDLRVKRPGSSLARYKNVSGSSVHV
jgi:hypothetical protein